MRPTEFRLPGAVDLSGLGRPPAPAKEAGAPGVVVVTEENFATEVLERSRTVPVVVDFWATWCGPCRQLSPTLERLAAEADGAWVLATVDVDANQRLAAAFQIQSIPTVLAVVDGAPVNGFLGALPEQQIRQFLDEVLAGAPTGAAPSDGAAPESGDPGYDQAEQAVADGDYATAAARYREVLGRAPGDEMAARLLAQVELLDRTKDLDERVLRVRAAGDPADLEAALGVADIDLLGGHVADAIDRLVDLVRRTSGADRDRVRTHLLGLFGVLEPDDPRLAAGRRKLSSALF